MDIISLKDESVRHSDGRLRQREQAEASSPVTTGRARRASGMLHETHLLVTDIKQAVKNQNRANIFIDGKYDFSLDIAQLVDFKLKVGQVLTEQDLEKYRKASKYGKLYQRTLEWVLTRPHSVRETKDYLFRKKAEKEDSEKILKTLEQKGYLNDETFAKFYVENRFVKKGISKKRLELELMKKGVDKTIIETAFSSSDRNDEDEIKKIIEKKKSKYNEEQMIRYLLGQGFSYDLIKNNLNQ